MENNKIHKVIVIGSGPAGLTAALYAARAELKPVLIAGQEPGGQLMRTSEVENFPGFPKGILGPELMGNMMKQVEHFGTKIMQENVESVDFSRHPFIVKTDKTEYYAKTVIISTGASANWLDLPNEQRLRGKGVSACATCDGFFFKGKDVVVIGGGDSAMEEATFLTKFANKVTVIHRREDFRASKIMLTKAKANPKIEFVTNSEVLDVLGKDSVEGIKIKNSKTGEETEIKSQGMFLAIGHTPNTKIFAAGGVEVDKKGYVAVKDNTRSNIEGVFIAGDVQDFRYRQAVTAAGMGCMAALDVEKYLAENE
ncbi:MAG: thioredoxin-disulfide reductase [Candidatus Doudnabacteria bacterium CG10_big_fil_rev_8_21_14_0_10_42_18]|uniref:Thioredoxin reductase n=1 Tax=Candidatus Doudnabacteria bacterium CG10_big_fil_rev_8_21_14_0_10_42_18 TaxID=1974552 RepID=A0A2H0VBF9_9BACT|nr:MAG: thioredoxin-disulfide reductase [Candidatus Doudnabacteria bacterium CG10_big_fil_rev_8_21_14_0_10_42_18]